MQPFTHVVYLLRLLEERAYRCLRIAAPNIGHEYAAKQASEQRFQRVETLHIMAVKLAPADNQVVKRFLHIFQEGKLPHQRINGHSEADDSVQQLCRKDITKKKLPQNSFAFG